MSPIVAMQIGHTHAEFAVLPGTPVAGIVGDFIRENLTEYEVIFNKHTFHKEYTVTGKYASFDHANGILHVPIGFADILKNTLVNRGAIVDVKPIADYPLRKINLKVLPEYTDQPHQVKLIEKCSELTPGMKGLAMQTGKGKTYAAIRSICNLGYAAVVIAPGLADQWIDSFEKFTGERDEVYKIQEFKSLAMLMQSDWKPKVFVCSIQTMQAYCKGQDNYACLPYNYKEFFEHYGIGVKVVDECHLNFHATCRMDLKSNVPYNLYCSATFGQTNRYASRIFDIVYPRSMRYGEDQYDKYVTVHFFHFTGEVQEKRCMVQRGYSHMRYENDLLRKRRKFEYHFEQLYVPIINQFYINERKKPGEKMLIFCSLVVFIQAVAKELRRVYPDLNVVEYTGDSTREVLDKADIIVATPGKAATGLDVKNLIMVYNTVSVRTPIITRQAIGRLRKIEGRDLIYVDRCDDNIGAHRRHAQDRKMELRAMAKKFLEYPSPSGAPTEYTGSMFDINLSGVG